MRDYACYNCLDSAVLTTEVCPSCNTEFKFPITCPPELIGNFKIIKPLSRGFYGITYVVENTFRQKKVLKVIPKKIYKKHGKNFDEECIQHANAADGTIHIVQIIDKFETNIEFSNGMILDCYVAVLDYIDGKILKDIFEEEKPLKANTIAQIAIDMFNILDTLYKKQINHNDLHEENIIVQNLTPETRRAEELDNTIKVVAIDLGSISDENKGGDKENRSSDIHWISGYLKDLSSKLIDNNNEIDEQDYRLASVLDNYARILLPEEMNNRIPNFDEIINEIKNSFYMQSMPWNKELNLKSFSDFYNAQTLEPWYIPDLLVDLDNNWLETVSGKGPLVITGMRGCGKTMLLKSLQFHARAKNAKRLPKEDIEILREDGFVGLYVNCNRLLDQAGILTQESLFEPLSRIFISYSIEAIKALRHLKDINPDEVKGDYYKEILLVCENNISNFDDFDGISSDVSLEKVLHKILSLLNRKNDTYKISINPVNIFPELSKSIRNCAKTWVNHFILFLLDDVSTRYLSKENIEILLSSLIFQDEICSFKFTSEIQTIEQKLYSPGQIEKVKIGRDIETFDLGSAVNSKIRGKNAKGGKYFILSILNKRKEYSSKHPNISPHNLLGDTSLKEISERIAKRDNKKQKKEIYYGLTALSSVCIGDIGDIIFLYDKILEKFQVKEIPISKQKQNECFQELCSLRLHEINKRGKDLKSYALSFANASHELLVKSLKDDPHRLRVYSSIYIRITEGDKEKIYEKIRKLIDAGIFVYSGGSNTPRTLGNDTNPINQFKLTYRKVLGLSTLIGLSQSDRFELSGKNLEEWIEHPERGRDILTKSVGGADIDDEFPSETDSEDIIINYEGEEKENIQKQMSFDFEDEEEISEENKFQRDLEKIVKEKVPKSNYLSKDEIGNQKFDLYITSLGFEDRTFESIKRCLSLIKPKKILLIKYEEESKSKEIIDFIKNKNIPYEIIDYMKIDKYNYKLLNNILLDISGMSKMLIFAFTRNLLLEQKKVYFSHTFAEIYYPLDKDITDMLENKEFDDKIEALDKITSEVEKGEKLSSKDIELYSLLPSNSDESKKRVLVAYSNVKYEKLFKLLESREFDIINILMSSTNSVKNSIAEMAADVINMSYPDTNTEKIDIYNIQNLLKDLTTKYFNYYLYQRSNFEFALTGPKVFAVACAAISAKFKVSQSWYLSSEYRKVDEFSKGTGETIFYKIEL